MITTTYSLNVGQGFSEVGFRLEMRKGRPVVLLRQGRSWIAIPVQSWDGLVEAIDEKIDDSPEVADENTDSVAERSDAGDDQPELGKLFHHTVTPAKWGRE